MTMTLTEEQVKNLINAKPTVTMLINLTSLEKLKVNLSDVKTDCMGLKYYESKELTGEMESADIIYMTRVQKERFSDPIEYERTKNAYVLKNSMLQNTKDTLKILHPLPRVNEIDKDVDSNSKAYYFTQALNGVFVRQAIITSILGLKQ